MVMVDKIVNILNIKKLHSKEKIIWSKANVPKDHYCNTTCILDIGCENSDHLVDVQNIVGVADYGIII